MAEAPAIHWFRQDLRLRDNPALNAAIATGRPVLPVYILDDEAPGPWCIGRRQPLVAASQPDVACRLISQKLGADLFLRRGHADTVIAELVLETGATAVHWNRCYEPYAIARDTGSRSC